MKSFIILTLFVTALILYQSTAAASHDEARALVAKKPIMSQQASFLSRLLSENNDMSFDDDYTISLLEKLSDGAGECYVATEALYENEQFVEDSGLLTPSLYSDGDPCVNATSSDGLSYSCTLDFTDAFPGLDAACAAVNGKVTTMDWSIVCSGTNDAGQPIDSSIASINAPQCVSNSACSAPEIEEIMAAIADASIFEFGAGFVPSCMLSFTINDSSGTPAVSLNKQYGDELTFLQIVQSSNEGGTSGTAKITTVTGFVATVLIAVAIFY